PGAPHRKAYAREEAREERRVLVLEDAAQGDSAGGRRQRAVGEIEDPDVRIALLVLEADLDGLLADPGPELDVVLLHQVAQVQGVPLVEIEADVDRLELLDGREQSRSAGADDVAGIHLPGSDAAGERRDDLRVAEVDLGELELRLRLV